LALWLIQARLPIRSPINFGVLLLMAGIQLSAVFGLDFATSQLEFYKFLPVFVLYTVLISSVRSISELVFLVLSFVIIWLLYFAKAEWEYFFNQAGTYAMGVHRLQGIDSTYNHPNSVASSVIYFLPFLLALFQMRKTVSQGYSPAWQQLFRFGILGGFAIALTTLFLTRSRGGVLALVVFLALQVLRGKNLARKCVGMIGLASLMAITFAILPNDIQTRIQSIWDEESGPENAHQSASGRWRGFVAGWTMFADHPIGGVGIGNFGFYRLRHVDGLSQSAHNLYGDLLGSCGVLGTIGFLGLLGASFLELFRLRRAIPFAETRFQLVFVRLAAACQDCLLLLLFNGLHSHNLFRFNWIFVAAVIALSRHLAESMPTSEESDTSEE
jgi:O-antigen ligase